MLEAYLILRVTEVSNPLPKIKDMESVSDSVALLAFK